MKRFCFLIQSLYGGGAERVVIGLSSTLLNMGHCVDIILLYNVFDYDVPDSRNLAVLPLFEHKLEGIYKYRIAKILYYARSIMVAHFKIKKMLAHKQYDVIVSHSLLTSLSCKFIQAENLYHCIHNEVLVPPLFQKTKRNWNALSHFLYTGQKLITVSGGIKLVIQNMDLKTKSIQVINNPFNFEKIRAMSEEYSVQEENYIISLGRLHFQKRFDILIRAYAQSHVEQKVLIFGKGEEEGNLKELIEELKLEGRVILKGFNPNPYPYVKNASALVLSSDYEGFPLVTVEALVLNTPVVSTNCFGTNELLTDGLSEFVSPVGNIDLLAQNIKKVIQSPPDIQQKYYERFSAPYIAQKYLELID